MKIKNPIIIELVNPAGVDKNIVFLQKKLSSNLEWLDLVFGRAVPIYKEGGERSPSVPIGNGEYFPVMPNDAQKSFSFFYPTGKLSPVEGDAPFQASQIFTQNVELVIWCNLKSIDNFNYALGEQLKEEVLSVLSKCRGTFVVDVISDDVKEVYSGWKIEASRDILMYPYYAMKFNLELSVSENKC